jgi:anti-sigma B factor antagonist
MELTIQTAQHNCTIALKGELDVSSCLILDAAIKKIMAEELTLKNLIVDCKELKYISSAGLGVFIENFQDMETRQIALIFHEMNTPVKDVFSITGLDSLFTILASNEEVSEFCSYA